MGFVGNCIVAILVAGCTIYYYLLVIITFCHITINLHLMIKVKIMYMAREPKRN